MRQIDAFLDSDAWKAFLCNEGTWDLRLAPDANLRETQVEGLTREIFENLAERQKFFSKEQMQEHLLQIYVYQEGENDEIHWRLIGRWSYTPSGNQWWNNGVYFYFDASTCYTGWDCQGGGTLCFGHDLSKMLF
jgi:hypothetical protein